jgi:hypothetical protein
MALKKEQIRKRRLIALDQLTEKTDSKISLKRVKNTATTNDNITVEIQSQDIIGDAKSTILASSRNSADVIAESDEFRPNETFTSA